MLRRTPSLRARTIFRQSAQTTFYFFTTFQILNSFRSSYFLKSFYTIMNDHFYEWSVWGKLFKNSS